MIGLMLILGSILFGFMVSPLLVLISASAVSPNIGIAEKCAATCIGFLSVVIPIIGTVFGFYLLFT